MEILLPNQNRAKTAMTMVWIVGALNAISFASDFFQYQLLSKVADGKIVTAEAASASDLRQRIIAIVLFITFIISAIAFILWFRRAYNNLHQKINFLSLSEGWAAGAWFVPIINLYRPYQIMKELYDETKKFLADRQIIYIQKLPVQQVGLWWTMWIVNGISGQVVFRMTQSADSVDGYLSATIASMIDNIIGIALVLITVKVIKDYADVEPLMAEISESHETVEEKVDLL